MPMKNKGTKIEYASGWIPSVNLSLELGLRDQHASDIGARNRRHSTDVLRRPRVDHRDDDGDREHRLTHRETLGPGQYDRQPAPGEYREREIHDDSECDCHNVRDIHASRRRFCERHDQREQDDAHDVVDDGRAQNRGALAVNEGPRARAASAPRC
jgi:hypothetical protein